MTAKQQQPQEEIVRTTLRLPAPLWAKLKHHAIDAHISIQEAAIRALEAYLKEQKKAGRP
jgi:hypothetical protein